MILVHLSLLPFELEKMYFVWRNWWLTIIEKKQFVWMTHVSRILYRFYCTVLFSPLLLYDFFDILIVCKYQMSQLQNWKVLSCNRGPRWPESPRERWNKTIHIFTFRFVLIQIPRETVFSNSKPPFRFVVRDLRMSVDLYLKLLRCHLFVVRFSVVVARGWGRKAFTVILPHP